MTVSELVELSQAMRIPAAPVTDGESILACPQYAERGFFIEGGSGSRAILPDPDRRSGCRRHRSRRHRLPRHLGAIRRRRLERARRNGDQRNDVRRRGTALRGLKVFDLSTFWAGAYLTCYLGAFGADVIKVESIQRPDGHRYSGALLREGDDWYERGPLWQGTNLNKRDITLDLTSAAGRELALRLAG